MQDAWMSLGQRIVEAARLAAAIHLEQSQLMPDESRQRVANGGADRRLVTEDVLPNRPATGGQGRGAGNAEGAAG